MPTAASAMLKPIAKERRTPAMCNSRRFGVVDIKITVTPVHCDENDHTRLLHALQVKVRRIWDRKFTTRVIALFRLRPNSRRSVAADVAKDEPPFLDKVIRGKHEARVGVANACGRRRSRWLAETVAWAGP